MKKYLLPILAFLLTSCSITHRDEPIIQHNERSLLSIDDPQYQTAKSVSYNSGSPEEDELEGIQCPIPMSDRVRNYTGVQCVFSSTEMLGRWAECKQLIDPPLTSRNDCKSYSGPDDLDRKLTNLGVKFEQTTNKKDGLVLIKKAMAEGRGCLFGVPGHAMVLIHYDEEKNIVKWVDNSDRSLRVQTMSIEKFNGRWQGWILVLYAEPDVIPYKILKLANQIPIVDHNNPQGNYPKNYVPTPKK